MGQRERKRERSREWEWFPYPDPSQPQGSGLAPNAAAGTSRASHTAASSRDASRSPRSSSASLPSIPKSWEIPIQENPAHPGKSQSRKILHIPGNPNPLKSRTSQEIPMRLNPQHPRKSQSLQLPQGQFGDRELTDLLSWMMARVPKEATKFPHPQNPGGHQDLYSPPGGGKSSLNSLTVPKNSKK